MSSVRLHSHQPKNTILLDNLPTGTKIKYQVHVPSIVWQSWVYDGALVGTKGDITGLFDKNGITVVEYTYDSWGKLISTIGSLASTVGDKIPFRYSGATRCNMKSIA